MGHSAAMEMPGTNDKFTGIDYNGKLSAFGRPEEDPLIETILSEGGEDFSTYLRLTGLAGESNLMFSHQCTIIIMITVTLRASEP